MAKKPRPVSGCSCIRATSVCMLPSILASLASVLPSSIILIHFHYNDTNSTLAFVCCTVICMVRVASSPGSFPLSTKSLGTRLGLGLV